MPAQCFIIIRIATDGNRSHSVPIEPLIARCHLRVLYLGDGRDEVCCLHGARLQPGGEKMRKTILRQWCATGTPRRYPRVLEIEDHRHLKPTFDLRAK